MAKSSREKSDEIEFVPDAWERFEKLVKSAAKIGPKPHEGSRPSLKKPAKEKPAKE